MEHKCRLQNMETSCNFERILQLCHFLFHIYMILELSSLPLRSQRTPHQLCMYLIWVQDDLLGDTG